MKNSIDVTTEEQAMTENFQKKDLSFARKVYVVGDIHGMFSLLEDELHALGFDKKLDVLVSVGDLVDRGPESHLAARYAQEPWFIHIRGNHEDLTAQAGGTSWHISNGGEWYAKLGDVETRNRFSEIINDAPIVLEVARGDKKYGFVHADFPTNDWDDAWEAANRHSEYCMWNRDRVARAQHDSIYRVKFGQKPENDWHKPIRNVDHVFFGHTPQENVLTVDNCTWLDTGAVFGWMRGTKDTNSTLSGAYKLTIVDLDAY
jgi:serine/threonine protein phosphatase 1